MSALAVSAASATDDMAPEDIGKCLGDIITVELRLRKEADVANLDNCERTLRRAARMLTDLWESTQRERGRRAGIEASASKRPALA